VAPVVAGRPRWLRAQAPDQQEADVTTVDRTDLEGATEAVEDLVEQLDATVTARADRAEAEARIEAARAALAERLDLVRDALGERARTQGAELASWARTTGGDLADRAGPVLAERAGQAREDLARRWHELEEELPVDVDTIGQQAQRGLWQAVSALLSVVLLVPRLLVTGLRQLGTLADDVADRGVVAGERARELAAQVPPSKRERRRRRLRTAAWTGAGFGVGLLVGWLLGQREPAAVPYEPADLRAHLTEPVTTATATAPDEGAAVGPTDEPVGDTDAEGAERDDRGEDDGGAEGRR
jgi:hypothetical protein